MRAGMRATARIVVTMLDEVGVASDIGHQQLDVRVRRGIVHAPAASSAVNEPSRRRNARGRRRRCTSIAVRNGSLMTGGGGNGGVVSDLLAALVLVHGNAIVDRLRSIRPAYSPLRFAAAATVVDTEAVAPGDVVLVQRAESGRQRRYVQVYLDGSRARIEADCGLDGPDRGFLVRP